MEIFTEENSSVDYEVFAQVIAVKIPGKTTRTFFFLCQVNKGSLSTDVADMILLL